MIAIWKRELNNYFYSLNGYIFIAFFLVFSGFFFYASTFAAGRAVINDSMYSCSFLLLFLAPILTMRLMADERKTKTDQLLITSPISISEIVVGKYLAAVSVFAVTNIITFIYPILLATYGNPGFGMILASYIGFFLLGCALIALGLFISSLTEDLIISAVASFGVMLFLWFFNFILDQAVANTTNPIIKNIVLAVSELSVLNNTELFLTGMISLASVVYFVSFALLFIYLTVRVIEKRRWS